MRKVSNRRIRRTSSEWRDILHRFETSKLSARAFCKQESLSVESLRRWREKLAASAVRTTPASFVEVAPEEGFPSFWSLELELPDGRVVRVRG